MSLLSKVLRAGEGKVFTDLQAVTRAVNDLEAGVESLTDADLRARSRIVTVRFAPHPFLYVYW